MVEYRGEGFRPSSVVPNGGLNNELKSSPYQGGINAPACAPGDLAAQVEHAPASGDDIERGYVVLDLGEGCRGPGTPQTVLDFLRRGCVPATR